MTKSKGSKQRKLYDKMREFKKKTASLINTARVLVETGLWAKKRKILSLVRLCDQE